MAETESPFFRAAIKHYDNDAVFPSRKTLRAAVVKDLEKESNFYLEKIIVPLMKQPNFLVATSNDCSTSTMQNPYCSLVANIIDTVTNANIIYTIKWNITM